MHDPTTTSDIVKKLIEITIQYLCERELRETCEAIDANFARSRKLLESYEWPTRATRVEWRSPVRKRGRPLQRRDRHLQIAGAVALLVEDAGLKPTRNHCGSRPRGPSACFVVIAALEQLNERLDERTVEGIWDRYRQSSRLI